MIHRACVFVAALLAGLVSCDDDGGGTISRYCEAFCTWQDECTDWFDDSWGSQGECVRQCKEDIAEGWDGGECRSEWLSYYTCYYEESSDDCDGSDVQDECDAQWDRLQDCWDEHDQYHGDEY